MVRIIFRGDLGSPKCAIASVERTPPRAPNAATALSNCQIYRADMAMARTCQAYNAPLWSFKAFLCHMLPFFLSCCLPCWRFGDNSEHGIQLVSAKLEFNRNTSTTKNSNVAEVWQDSEVYVIATIVRDLFTALRKRESETSETEIRFFNVLKEHVFRQCQVKVRAYSPRSCWPRARTIFPRSRRTSRLSR